MPAIRRSMAVNFLAVVLTGLGPAGAAGESLPGKGPEMALASAAIDEITVIGSAGSILEVPGAVAYISDIELDRQTYTDIHRILRQAPGVNIQEEDGYGLKPNIGIRGSGADRSARISLQEDGIPIAPAPYAAPAAYYFPYAGRLNAIEVAKGPAVIKYGPRTSGGAINLLSTPIPAETAAKAEFLYGGNDTRRLHAWAGTRANVGSINIGAVFETFQFASDGFKTIDAGGSAGFDIEDFVFQFGLFSQDGARLNQSLIFKIQRSNETANETYLGLTDADFNADPVRRYNASQLDEFTSRHETYQASYSIDLTSELNVSVTGYHTKFARDWFKIEEVLGTRVSTILADPAAFAIEFENIVGAAGFAGPDDALSLRHNNRKYGASGVHGTVSYAFGAGAVDHAIEASLRYHEDSEDRFQHDEFYRMENSRLVRTSVGAPGSQTNRLSTANATAGYIQDNIDWNRLHATLGVRVEEIELTRRDFSTADPGRVLGPTRVRKNSVLVALPGAGIVFDLTDDLSVLGGVYRGFAPPGPGSAASVEKSIAYETGFRYDSHALTFEAIGYLNAFENLVGTCTASTGGSCAIGDQFDAGRVEVVGVEVTAAADLSRWIKAPFELPVSAVYTLTNATFQNSFSSGFSPWGDVEAGDALPYISQHQIYFTAAARGEHWGVEGGMYFQTEQRTIAGQGTIAPDVLLSDRLVVDFSSYIEIADGVRIRAKVENAFDETYAASRRPAGLRPGLPRTFFIGVDLAL